MFVEFKNPKTGQAIWVNADHILQVSDYTQQHKKHLDDTESKTPEEGEDFKPVYQYEGTVSVITYDTGSWLAVQGSCDDVLRKIGAITIKQEEE